MFCQSFIGVAHKLNFSFGRKNFWDLTVIAGQILDGICAPNIISSLVIYRRQKVSVETHCLCGGVKP
jgi:hypothetical protein